MTKNIEILVLECQIQISQILFRLNYIKSAQFCLLYNLFLNLKLKHSSFNIQLSTSFSLEISFHLIDDLLIRSKPIY